jgi:insulysin
MLEALVRFGSFFSGPLFIESVTGRELNAIDSEHAKNLQSDMFRLYELEKIVLIQIIPTVNSLQGIKLLDRNPKRQGINSCVIGSTTPCVIVS